MSTEETESVELSKSVLSQIRDRAEMSGFDSADEYIEYVLNVVLHELDPVERELSERDEAGIRSRLESLGYIDD